MPNLSDDLPLRQMDAGKEHQRFCFIAGKPGIGYITTFLFARRIRFSEAGDWDKASVFDAEPSRPVREIELTHVCRAEVAVSIRATGRSRLSRAQHYAEPVP